MPKNTCCMSVKTWFQTLRAYGKARWSTSSTVGGIEYHLGGLLAVSLTKMATHNLKAIMQSDSPFDVLLWPPHTRRVTQLHTQSYVQHSHRAENKRGGPVSNPKSQLSLRFSQWDTLFDTIWKLNPQQSILYLQEFCYLPSKNLVSSIRSKNQIITKLYGEQKVTTPNPSNGLFGWHSIRSFQTRGNRSLAEFPFGIWSSGKRKHYVEA